MTTQPLPCEVEELSTLFLFENPTEEQLARLCREGRVERFEPGPVHQEGDPATCFFVLPAATFASIMRDWFPMAVHLLEGLFFGTQATQQTVNQRERLLALGSLSAGLTHELNNPAAAAVRATSALRERMAGLRHKLAAIAVGPYAEHTLALVHLQERTAEQVSKSTYLSPLEASDREDALADRLDERDIADGWEMAATFVQAGLDMSWRIVVTKHHGSLQVQSVPGDTRFEVRLPLRVSPGRN